MKSSFVLLTGVAIQEKDVSVTNCACIKDLGGGVKDFGRAKGIIGDDEFGLPTTEGDRGSNSWNLERAS